MNKNDAAKPARPEYTATSPDGVEIYRGPRERYARAAAREYAETGFIGHEAVVRRGDVRLAGYVGTESGIRVVA